MADVPPPTAALTLNATFPTLAELQGACADVVLGRGESWEVLYKDKGRLGWVCRAAQEGCKFTIKAIVSTRTNLATIRTLDLDHTCIPSTHLNFPAANSAARIAARNLALVQDDPQLRPRAILTNERVNHGNQVPYLQAWRGKQTAVATLGGTDEEQYAKLPGLLQEMRNADPDTYTHFTHVDGKLDCAFLAPASSRHAFQTMRRFVALDGTHMHGTSRLILLIAVGINANQEVLPLAWSLAPSEDGASWDYFARHFRTAFPSTVLNPSNPKPFVFISDRDKGLHRAVATIFPSADHSSCCQHIAENVNKKGGKKVKDAFWGLAKAETVEEFERKMAVIERDYPTGARYIKTIDPKTYATFAFPSPRFGDLTSNIIESYNHAILPQRELQPVRALLSLYITNGEKVYQRSKAPQKSPRLTNYALGILSTNIQAARPLKVQQLSNTTASVGGQDEEQEFVDLFNGRCSCGLFQDLAIPCVHAVALCRYAQLNPEVYVDVAYSIAVYRLQYSHVTVGARLEDVRAPDGQALAPPAVRKKGGRPKTKRIRRTEASAKAVTCSLCKKPGHNKRTCSS